MEFRELAPKSRRDFWTILVRSREISETLRLYPAPSHVRYPGGNQSHGARMQPPVSANTAEVLFSCGGPDPFGLDFVERAAIAIEGGFQTRVLLPALNNAISVFRVDLHQPRFSLTAFAANQR
jgi:hypothetical protein